MAEAEARTRFTQRIARIVLTPWFVLGLLVVVIIWGVLITPIQPMGYS